MFRLEKQESRSQVPQCLVCDEKIKAEQLIVRIYRNAKWEAYYRSGAMHTECVSQVMSAIIDNYEGAR